MAAFFSRQTLDKLFFWGILIKAFIGFWEFLAGAFLAISGKRILDALGIFLSKKEAQSDTDDKVFHYLAQLTASVTHDAELFAAAYLMFHGAVDVVLAVILAKKKIAWYPLVIFLLCLFIVYEIYRFFLHHSLIVLALIIFDIAFVGVVFLEYTRMKKVSA